MTTIHFRRGPVHGIRSTSCPSLSELLESLIPIQQTIKTFDLDPMVRHRKNLPWHTYRDLWRNNGILSLWAKGIIQGHEEQSESVRQGRSVRRWLKIAAIERGILVLFPSLPCLFTLHAIAIYQLHCVACRTYCEFYRPDLIDLFVSFV